MSLLDNAALAEVTARLSGNSEQPEQKQSSLETQPSEPKNDEQNMAPSAQVNEREDSQEKLIPYDRFKKVNDTKKEYQRKLDEQSKELERLRKELESKSSNSKEDSDDWLNDLFGDEPKDKSQDKYSELEQRVYAFELEKAEMKLDKLVNDAVRNHKDFPAEIVESLVYQTITNDPNADIDDVMDNLKKFVSLIKNDNKQLVKEEPRFSAPSRASSVGQKQYSAEQTVSKPKTVAEGTAALRDYLTKNKIF